MFKWIQVILINKKFRYNLLSYSIYFTVTHKNCRFFKISTTYKKLEQKNAICQEKKK